jgi:hypothetical protein
MKKLKFDTLFESLMLNEGNKSKQERYGNVNFNVQKLIDKLEDSESDDYKSIIDPAIDIWKGRSYLGNLTKDNIKSMVDDVATKLEQGKNNKINYLKYSDIISLLDKVTSERFPVKNREGMSVLATTWSSKLQGLILRMKDTHEQGSGEQKISDESDEDSLPEPQDNSFKNQGIKEKVLQTVQASDSMSKEEIIRYLIGRMSRNEISAESIVDSLISSGDLVQNEDGNLEVSRETKEVETLGTVSDDDFDIQDETGIPFREDDLTAEDEGVDAAFRDAIESDPYKNRDY